MNKKILYCRYLTLKKPIKTIGRLEGEGGREGGGARREQQEEEEEEVHNETIKEHFRYFCC